MKILLLVLFIVFVACESGRQYPEGGYEYPKHVDAKDTDFYYYPLKNTFPRKDSFEYGREHLFFELFKEPNLSIRSMNSEVFRFVYSRWSRKTYIILLTENKITIKSGYNGRVYWPDTSGLTKIENEHLRLFNQYFPLDEPKKNPLVNHRLDSLTRLFPRLLDPAYYKMLDEKSYTRDTTKLEYTEVVIPVSKEQYRNLVSQFNNSGFWKLPLDVTCDGYSADGYASFYLEANTKEKYQVVQDSYCFPADTTRFAYACQRLVDFVHLEKEIRCYDDHKGADSTKMIIQDVQLEDVKPEKPKKHHRSSSK